MHTGKSVSEALILQSVNPQYDDRLFIEFPEKCCVQMLFWMSKQKTKMFWTCKKKSLMASNQNVHTLGGGDWKPL